MLAQSLVEYSLVASASETVQRGRILVEGWVGSLSSGQWAMVGGVILFVLAIRSIRRSR
jgi:hypothetical protein